MGQCVAGVLVPLWKLVGLGRERERERETVIYVTLLPFLADRSMNAD
jgi:hypothetical protein